jgi:hypothetical protein
MSAKFADPTPVPEPALCFFLGPDYLDLQDTEGRSPLKNKFILMSSDDLGPAADFSRALAMARCESW